MLVIPEAITYFRAVQEAPRHCNEETTEMQLASFIAEHNLPFTGSKSLFSIVQSRASQESSQIIVLKYIRLRDRTCANVIRQGPGT